MGFGSLLQQARLLMYESAAFQNPDKTTSELQSLAECIPQAITEPEQAEACSLISDLTALSALQLAERLSRIGQSCK